MEPGNPTNDDPEPKLAFSRRRVLQAAGTTAAFGVAAVGGAGTAAATDEAEPPVFCGCSQVCACGTGNAQVVVAVEEGDTFRIEDDLEYIDFNFCATATDLGFPDGKIIAVGVGGTRWLNPGQCAKKALEVWQKQSPTENTVEYGRSGGPCGKPPCEHPGGGPPSKGGPSNGGPP